MKITKFSTEQFAGIKNKSVDFADGINVVFGENESGKTTLINAIYRTLTEPQKLSKASKSGKEFIEECFPCGKSNIIFSNLQFSDSTGLYTVKREWDKNGKDNTTKIILPDSTVINGGDAENKLRELLIHPNAIYDNLVFGRQKHQEQILEWCYDFFSKSASGNGIDEARNTVSLAFSAAGGVSSEKLSQMLDEKIDEKAKLWDFTRNAPKDGKMNWVKGTGSIVKSYYNYFAAKSELEKMQSTEQQIRRCAELLNDCSAKKTVYEHKLQELSEQRLAIENADNIRKLRENSEITIKKAKQALTARDNAIRDLETAKNLQKLENEAKNKRLKAEASKQLESINTLDAEITELKSVTSGLSSLPNDCQTARELSRVIENNKALLGTGKVHAEIKMQSPHSAQITLADNTVHEYVNDEVDINGFFRINIPNVGEITVAPQNVDVKRLLTENDRNTSQLCEIFKRYSVENLSALVQKSSEYEKNTANLNSKIQLRSMYTASPEELTRQLGQIVTDENISIPENLDRQITDFLAQRGLSSAESCISRCETNLDSFKQDYSSPENAQKIIDEETAKIAEYSLSPASVISKGEYEREIARLNRDIQNLAAKREETSRSLGSLEAGFKDISELSDETEKLKSVWERELHLCKCYMRIRDDLKTLLASTDDKYGDFNKKFAKYLEKITDNSVTMDITNSVDTLSLTSGTNTFANPNLLSEGTKKAVLLAFRLAVLDYFFPDGGGLIVLDDDLLDMDAARRGQSAKLLTEFAQRNQVIIMTCDESIANLMGGNRITVTR